MADLSQIKIDDVLYDIKDAKNLNLSYSMQVDDDQYLLRTLIGQRETHNICAMVGWALTNEHKLATSQLFYVKDDIESWSMTRLIAYSYNGKYDPDEDGILTTENADIVNTTVPTISSDGYYNATLTTLNVSAETPPLSAYIRCLLTVVYSDGTEKTFSTSQLNLSVDEDWNVTPSFIYVNDGEINTIQEINWEYIDKRFTCPSLKGICCGMNTNHISASVNDRYAVVKKEDLSTYNIMQKAVLGNGSIVIGEIFSDPKIIEKTISTPPSTDGTYRLTCTVSDSGDTVVYSWVSA